MHTSQIAEKNRERMSSATHASCVDFHHVRAGVEKKHTGSSSRSFGDYDIDSYPESAEAAEIGDAQGASWRT